MATEYTSSYWSSVGSTDRARRRADQLLDTLAKRALIFQNTCDFQWDIDDDAELEEFLESMACPPVDPIRCLHHLSTAEPAAFLVWQETMAHILAELKTDRMKQAAQFILTQRLDLTVTALLTPETLWPEEAQEAGLQHVVLSWPTVRLLLDAVIEACDPREVLLLLPRLGEAVLRAASHVHTCAAFAAITYLPAAPDDDARAPAAPGAARPSDAEADGAVEGGGGAGQKPVTVAEVAQGKRAFDEVVEHLVALAVRAFGRLERRNAAHVGDVLAFVGKIAMAYNFQRDPPRDHPASVLMGHHQTLPPPPVGTFAAALLQAVCSTAWLWLQAPREACTDAEGTPALGVVRPCSACCVLRTAPQKCGRCLQEFYCSRRCQKKRWPNHKQDCTPVDTAAAVAEEEHAAAEWPAVAAEARQRVLSAMLQALEPLGHTPALTEHLSHAAPGVLHDVARTLCALGLDSYSTADWAALVPADVSDPGTSEEDEEAGSEVQGSDAESAGDRGLQARSMAAGAAVALAAHVHYRLQHPASSADDGPGRVPTDWLESPHVTVQAACVACMPLLDTARDLQSASGMANAFQVLQDAAQAAVPQPRGRPWVVGVAAESGAAQCAQQAMCAAAVASAKVALVAMTVAAEEHVRVAARNALQELARVMPAVECAAMLERFISGLDAPGVQSQLLYVVFKRMQAGKDGAMHVSESQAGAEGARETLWEGRQVADLVLGPLLRLIKLTKSKKYGLLETMDAMPLPKAQHFVHQSELVVACLNILIFQVSTGVRGSLPDGFAQCVEGWLGQYQVPKAPGLRSPVRCLLERVDAARAALEAAGKAEEALGMALITCAASRLQDLLGECVE